MDNRSEVLEMSDLEKDETPMLSEAHSQYLDEPRVSHSHRRTSRNRSASISIPMNSMESYQTESSLVSHTGPLRNEKKTPFIPMSGPLLKSEGLFPPTPGVRGHRKAEPRAEKFPSCNGMEWNKRPHNNYAGKNEHLLRSGQLGVCNDPYCTICPTHFIDSRQQRNSKFHSAFYGDARGWARRFFSSLQSYVPGIMNPHTKVVQQWNRFFVISCLLAIFVDPLFFLLLSVQQENKCIIIDMPLTKTIVVFRSMTDFIYLLNMLLQFRLAYVAPESRVVGAGDLVDHPKKIAIHYLCGYFLIDLFIVLPLPQIMILLVLPMSLGTSGANYAKNLLRTAVLVQYIPRLYRFLPFLAGQSPSGFIFESAWANFVINLLTFVLSGHVVGSCWYLFGLQRVNQCLRDACHNSKINNCMDFIDCGHGEKVGDFRDLRNLDWQPWKNNENASACFSDDGFPYGIYTKAVILTTKPSIVTRYTYSLFWGFQQISTLAGNQTPSYFLWEVLFTMGIIGLGLLLFALLIGNMQNFLQALGRRRLEMSLRRRDVEQWMSHRRLSEDLRRQVRQAERYNWAATRGVNEEMLMENLPEDLQREIRRHLFKFVKNVHIFSKMGDSKMGDTILDAICERLRQKTYIKGSKILCDGGLIEKMVFIVRGKMLSNGVATPLGEGDVCGEELLAWCIENSSVNKDGKKIRFPGQRLLSNRDVECLTNVEAFILRAADIEEVTGIFSRFLRNPKVQGAIRYQSPYWRTFAATRIQVAWRYRKKCLSRADTSNTQFNHL